MLASLFVALLLFTPAADAANPLPRLKAVPNPDRGGRIVDDAGREVLLRGVNVNSLGQYWKGSDVPPTFPLDRRDPRRIAEMGWNTVRLLVSWSRIEPQPGKYNEAYLNQVALWIERLEKQGVYTIIDFHQDAWGATLAARPDEACAPPSEPAYGWDGAPGWATMDEGKPRCTNGAREANLAVVAAWNNFFANSPAADGVGIQTRYVNSLKRVAKRFARSSAVAGIDVMNEPGAFGPDQNKALSEFYAKAVKAIRSGEKAGRGFRHLILFEPSVLWSLTGSGAPPVFSKDSNLVYAPHIYSGSFGGYGPPSPSAFETVVDEAKTFGGVPVLTGEWGGSPSRATGRDDDYFNMHQSLQDEFHFSATIWQWKQSCGDPHSVTRDGSDPSGSGWSVYEVDCKNGGNRLVRQAPLLRKDLRRAYVRRAPGRLVTTSWKQAGSVFEANGKGNRRGFGPLEIFYPKVSGVRVRINGSSPRNTVSTRVIGKGTVLSVPISSGRWTVSIREAAGK